MATTGTRAGAKVARTKSAVKKTAAKKSATAKRAAKTGAAKRPAAKQPAGKRAAAKGGAHHASDPSHYTDPALRDRLKDQVLAGDKGGRPGQWSARKAQLLAHEYEAAGGGYTGEKSPAQAHLHDWTEERWTTADKKPAIRGKTTARYLPEKAWADLTPAERRATDKKKRSASKSGRQFVANTGPAAKARRDATAHGEPHAAPRATTKAASKRPATKRGAAKRGAAKTTPVRKAGARKAVKKTAASTRARA